MPNERKSSCAGGEELSKRQRQTAETRERIFRAAIQLFAERGLENVTIEHITDRADVGKGTFFNYFPNKEAVLQYFGGTQLERLQQALAAGQITGHPRECILKMLLVLAEHPLLTPDLVRALYVANLASAPTHEVDRPSIWHILEIVAESVREGQACGMFRTDQEPKEAALFVFGQFFLSLLTWCTGFSPEPLPDTVRRFGELALDGLSTAPHSPRC